MEKLKELSSFLVEAKKSTYASGDKANKIINDDKSTTLVFIKGDWKYHDNYFGGEPYGGREVVFYKNLPIYIMVYYGFVDKTVPEFNSIYKVLQSALSLIPEEKPFRGPLEYIQDNLIYKNNFQGEVDNFQGEEFIYDENGKILYNAKYIGGLIDQKR